MQQKCDWGRSSVWKGGGDMAKSFEKNSAKKEREVGVSNLINFWVLNFVLLRNLKMSCDPLKGGFFFLGNLKTNSPEKQGETRGVSHCGLAIYIKTYLKAKDELWKLKYFTRPKYKLPKIL
jgi:hypothetical protein